MEETGNSIHLRGHVCQPLQFGHELFGEQFFVTTLRVPRLSGAEDFLPITLSERLLIDEPIAAGSILCLDGQLRSYNKVVEGSGRLLITAFAQRLLPEEDEENPNRVQLTGALCKAPSYRTTPFGREIADLMLAVNRSYGKLYPLHHVGTHGPVCGQPEDWRQSAAGRPLSEPQLSKTAAGRHDPE